MKRYSDTPINVRLGRYQETKLNEMIKNENYCQQRGIFSKVDAVRTGLNKTVFVLGEGLMQDSFSVGSKTS